MQMIKSDDLANSLARGQLYVGPSRNLTTKTNAFLIYVYILIIRFEMTHLSPKWMMESRSCRPHLGHARLVECLRNVEFSVTSNKRTNSQSHSMHNSTKQFPCSSDNCRRSIPERRCRPSQFCETTCFTWPARIRALSAMCEYVGWTRAKSGHEILIPLANIVHNP